MSMNIIATLPFPDIYYSESLDLTILLHRTALFMQFAICFFYPFKFDERIVYNYNN